MMKELKLLTYYQLMNILRAKWLIFYALFFLVFTNALLMFDSDPSKTVASLLSIVLFVVPLINILYSTFYWYNSESFHSILLTQPVRRSFVFLSTWVAISVALIGSYLLGTSLALVMHQALEFSFLAVLFYGAILSFIFVGLGLWVAVSIIDKMKGIGLAFLLCLYFALFHDVLVFALASSLKEYPIEVPSLFLMAVNPIDLTRTQVLLTLNLSVMMGYTGKILKDILSSSIGFAFTGSVLVLWVILPIILGIRTFQKRNLR